MPNTSPRYQVRPCWTRLNTKTRHITLDVGKRSQWTVLALAVPWKMADDRGDRNRLEPEMTCSDVFGKAPSQQCTRYGFCSKSISQTALSGCRENKTYHKRYSYRYNNNRVCRGREEIISLSITASQVAFLNVNHQILLVYIWSRIQFNRPKNDYYSIWIPAM